MWAEGDAVGACGPRAMQRVAEQMSPGLRPPPLFGKTPSPYYATHCIALGGERRWFAYFRYQHCAQDLAAGALSAAA